MTIRLLLCFFLLGTAGVWVEASTNSEPCAVVRGAADYSLMLSLVKDTPIQVRMMPKRKTSCACCQHGAPHAHMTVSEARNHSKSCMLPRLKNYGDVHQVMRMIGRWSHALIRAFPEHKEAILLNKNNVHQALTQLEKKWENSNKKPMHEAEIDVSPTIGGYVEAFEKWQASQEVEAHAERPINSSSQTR